eukprot:snap_masked-scaffold_5-processed-gene-7.29-mRNA-1 protein AED:1.00 eAED:1.00 QI:0/-1/0/0/-1/1/1/0/355
MFCLLFLVCFLLGVINGEIIAEKEIQVVFEFIEQEIAIREILATNCHGCQRDFSGINLQFSRLFIPVLPPHAFQLVDLQGTTNEQAIFIRENSLRFIHPRTFENAALLNSQPVFENVEFLSIAQNPFVSVPDNLIRRKDFPNLHFLSITESLIKNFSAQILEPGFCLDTLDLNNNPNLEFDPNPILTEPISSLFLRKVNVAAWQNFALEMIKGHGIRVFRRLRQFVFGDEVFEKISPDLFTTANFPQLEQITIFGPNLEPLPNDFFTGLASTLEVVRLEKTSKITAFPEALKVLDDLVKLSIMSVNSFGGKDFLDMQNLSILRMNRQTYDDFSDEESFRSFTSLSENCTILFTES